MEKLRNIEKDNTDFIDRINCTEIKKKEVDRIRSLTLDRKQCTGRHEMRKEERRNETFQHRKKGWKVNLNRTEERKLD